jgi:DNA modification methylase
MLPVGLQLREGDCLEELKSLPDGSIDAIVTDPPYGMNFQSNWVPDDKKKAKIAGDEKPFIWFLYQAQRVLKDGGALVCFTDWKNQELWRLAIDCAGFAVRSHCVWDRVGHGMGDLKASFGPRHDVFWFATKGAFAFPGKRPQSVLRHQRPASHMSIHPTRKPVELMREIVAAVTGPGEMVLDPFAGSGSTGEAAVAEGRRCILIERDPVYAADIRSRLDTPELVNIFD